MFAYDSKFKFHARCSKSKPNLFDSSFESASYASGVGNQTGRPSLFRDIKHSRQERESTKPMPRPQGGGERGRRIAGGGAANTTSSHARPHPKIAKLWLDQSRIDRNADAPIPIGFCMLDAIACKRPISVLSRDSFRDEHLLSKGNRINNNFY